MPAWINVVPLHLPARGRRQHMAPIHDWPGLIELLLQDLQIHLGHPFAIFGHSMGALIGIELAHEIKRRFQYQPVGLFMSACIAPARREQSFKWLTCPRDEVLAEMKSLNGTTSDVLENRELMDLLLPMLRADFHLCGTHRHVKRPPLAAPMLVLAGAQDIEVVKDHANLSAWEEEVAGPFDMTTLNAGHFFVHTHADQIITAISERLASHRS